MKNIQKTKHQNQMRRQKGFTLMEIAIVMIIMAALVGTMASSLWSKQDTMSIQQTVLFFNKGLPQAIANMKLRGYKNCFTSVGVSGVCAAPAADGPSEDDIHDLLVDAGAPALTEWGERWDAHYYGQGVLKITYPAKALSASAKGDFVRVIQTESGQGGALIQNTSDDAGGGDAGGGDAGGGDAGGDDDAEISTNGAPQGETGDDDNDLVFYISVR